MLFKVTPIEQGDRRSTLSIFQTHQRSRDSGDGPAEVTLLSHNGLMKDEPSYNMILFNNSMYNNDSRDPLNRPRRLQNGPNYHGPHSTHSNASHLGRGGLGGCDLGEGSNNEALYELVSHVKQINEELHQRYVSQDGDDQLKSEWRMIAVVLDRLLLIIFLIMTIFTSIIIFVNVPS